jgi:Glu-tRNA(Gln) amidotransferase subunit E-like FAD-binding protein
MSNPLVIDNWINRLSLYIYIYCVLSLRSMHDEIRGVQNAKMIDHAVEAYPCQSKTNLVSVSMLVNRRGDLTVVGELYIS